MLPDRRSMTKRASSSLILIPGQKVILLLALMTVLAVSVSAQSGRKAPKSKTAPPPEPESVPAPIKPTEKEKARLTFIVGIDRDLSFVSIPVYFSEGVLRACADRLDAGPSVDVDVSPREVNRGEAVKRAKAEKEAYVVLLNLRSDSMNSSSGVSYQDIYLEYVVFTPQTGKVATSGRTYQRSVGRVIGVPGTSSAAVEYALKDAARAAAERILDAMSSRISEDRVPG